MKDSGFDSFDEFWSWYVRQHARPSTRRVHFVATTAAMGIAAYAVAKRRWWLLAAVPVAAWGPSILSHYVFEKNHPTSYRHPLWSLRADLRMWAKTLDGSMSAEVERIVSEASAGDGASSSSADPTAEGAAEHAHGSGQMN